MSDLSHGNPINVGLLGLGVVGGGVAATLLEHSESIAAKVGRPVNLKKVLVRDAARKRDVSVPDSLITTNPEDILSDPDIPLVVEVIGGESPAAQYLKDALQSGKHVVTANKEVMAKRGPELLSVASRNGVSLLYEASVGGGIPIIGCLVKELVANRFHSVRSIINGTTNYILTRMANDHTDFSLALAEAQERGYAEADPTNDIEGFDAVYKLSILAGLAFHRRVPPESIYREGITRLQPQDFRYAHELGYAIKSLAIATEEGGAIQARVYPALVPQDNMLAKVDGVYNAVEVEGSLCGRVLIHGRGAGRGPTTSAVVGDLVEIARNISSGSTPLPSVAPEDSGQTRSIDDLECQYFLRLNIADRPGVLAQIARILGDQNISIASVLQKDANPEAQTAEIVITTHPARELWVQRALQQAEDLEVVQEINSLLRIED
ncbi:MAG: homoserine dehydrogenase [Chloroflexi bacterium]|nr:homoserine dehydrogenase [Chloroflexota bacterium]